MITSRCEDADSDDWNLVQLQEARIAEEKRRLRERIKDEIALIRGQLSVIENEPDDSPSADLLCASLEQLTKNLTELRRQL